MKLSDRVTVRPEVMARTVDNETVILDLESGTYFGLDQVGARIWELVLEAKSLTEICDVMIAEYDVSRDELQADVLKLARELERNSLVRVL